MTLWPALLVAILAREAAAEPPSPEAYPPGAYPPGAYPPGAYPPGADSQTEPLGPTQPTADAPATEAAASATAEARLNQAVLDYQAGDRESARNALAELVNDPALDDPALRQRARVYLGEVFYIEGQEDAAFRAFEQVLQADPDFHIDPFEHPPDVCGFFEVVRASTTSLRAAALPPRGPLPASAWLGFGVYQRRHGQKPMGNLLLAGQIALGVTSAAAFGWTVYDRTWLDTDPAEHTRMIVTQVVQVASGLGFWGLYAAGTLDARRHWRKDSQAQGSAESPSGKAVQIGATLRW